jgi:membrane protease YdiL (CAAX protease family)
MSSPNDRDARARARAGLARYFAFVALGSIPCYAVLAHFGAERQKYELFSLVLMWCPAFSSVAARLIGREGFADVSFRLRSPRVAKMMLLAWVAPLLVGLSAYPLAWLTGLEAWQAPAMEGIGLSGAPPVLKLAVSIAVNMTLGTALAAISATGEEIGWRGYMLTRLIDAGVSRPVLISGVIWGAWHMPLILSGVYAVGRYPFLSPFAFAVGIIAGSFVYARVRLESGSVWPAVLLHSAWNALIQGTFDTFTSGGSRQQASTLWTGESGLLVALFTVVWAWLLSRPRALEATVSSAARS